jgi:lanthanide-dependent methanol dehydrogenase
MQRRRRTTTRDVEVGVERQSDGWRALRRCAGAAMAVAMLAGCGTRETPGRAAATTTGSAATSTAASSAGDVALPAMATRGSAWLPPNAGAGDWLMPSRDYAGTRYSPLTEINTRNAAELQLAWTFDDGESHYGHEMTPLVANNTMYIVSPFPNRAFALDLTKPGAPVKWQFDANPSPIAIGKACCDAVNRGAALYDGKLIYNLLDDHTVAVDAATGKELWRTKLANVEDGTTTTMAPLVVDGKVYVGNSGGEMGVAGWIAALDVNTGKELWRAYSVGPDSLVRIGGEFKPFYSWMRGKDLGVSSWPANAWKHGAGAVWGWVTYDPELKQIFYGTSNTGPWNADQRPGLNLWTSGVFARNADDGMARWAYVMTPHNEWDYDAVNENILVDLPFPPGSRAGGAAGATRKVMVQFNRNGFAYTIDRTTGEVLVAKPFGHENWASGIDPKTAMPIINPEKHTVPPGRWVRDICPADVGVKDFEPSAFSPRTGLFYVSVQNICMDYRGHQVSYVAGTPYWGGEMTRHVGPGGNYGEFIAFDAATGRKVWGIPEPFLTYSGAMVTAGDVAFYGTVDGWFRAVDARTGKVLWSRKLGSGIISAPMSYQGPDGHQYVAVAAGVGGGAMVTASQPGFPARGSTYYVFTLGQNIPASPPAQQGSGSGGQAGKGGEKP